jgi:hypothetical protein
MTYDSAALGSTPATGSVVLALTSDDGCACGVATGYVEQPLANAKRTGINIAEQAFLANLSFMFLASF